MADPLDSPLPPPQDDLVARLDARLHEADMLRRFGTGAAPPVPFRHWHIERRLGRGGMGAVYLAVDQALARQVALKLVPHRPGSPPPDPARVRDEARALAAIKHRNVVQVHQVYLDDAAPILEMEFIAGETLRAWQTASARSWRNIVTAYASGGEGVAAMHRAGLVHRDVKPENLLMTDDGIVRLVDLGLARPDPARLDPSVASPAAGAFAGTVGYLAPEVFAGAEPDARSDQFAFCAALYEALAGVLPFHGDTPVELAQAMVIGRLTSTPSALALPEWLLAALRRGLLFDRDARHKDMRGLLDTLRQGVARRSTWIRRSSLACGVIGLLGVGWIVRPTPHDPCAAADAPTPLAADRLAMLRARVGPGPTPASHGLEVLETVLAARARTWADERGLLCRAPRTGGDPAATLGRWRCIERRNTDLQTILDAARAGPDLPARIVDAIAAIEQLPTCPAERRVDPDPERDTWLAERLAAAARHEDAGRYLEAERLARDVIAGAGDSSRRPEALYRLGHVLGAQDRSREALRELARAENTAYEQRSDELACQILAYRVKLRASTDLAVTDSEGDLERADSCIKRSNPQAPLLRADLLEARGLLAAAAGHPAVAVDHHQEALHLRRTHLGELHLDVSKSLHNLGNALQDRGEPLAALDHLEAALALRQKLVGPDHPLIADILHDLGHLHAELADPGRAREHYVRAATIIRTAGSARAPILADLEMSLADLDLAEGHGDAAATHLRQAQRLQAIDRDLAPSHPQRTLLLHLEARLHELRGDFAAALPLLTEATRQQRVHAPDSDEVLISAVNEIQARYAMQDYPGIAAIAREFGPRLFDHLRRQPPNQRGLLAWYIGASQAKQRAPAAIPYLALARDTYRDQGATGEVLQLQQELSLAQHSHTTPPP